jgi:Protein of unknown function, DUF485
MPINFGGVVDVVTTRGTDAVRDAWIHGIDSAEFKALVDAKQRAIVPMMVIYIVGYLGLSILAGFGRDLLGIKVLSSVNIGFVLIAVDLPLPEIGARPRPFSDSPGSPRSTEWTARSMPSAHWLRFAPFCS